MQKFNDSRDWFFEKRFGLFIHWGLHAIKGWHEQEIWRWPVAKSEYIKYLDRFNPVKFNAEEWLDHAESAGMEYVVFTTKHCDGFCNWDSRYTDFKITNTPYGKDVLRDLAEACQRRGFPLCLYYSIPDMHHPAYPHAGHPYELDKPRADEKADKAAYLEYVRNQASELLSNYGPIHGWWWDANVIEHVDESFHDMVRKLQLQAVINNRGFGEGDFATPERDWDNSINASKGFEKPTEACQSIGLYSWNWKADEDYYSDFHLKHSIAKVLSRRGNYLLNVGPMADGRFSDYSQNLLARIGEWKKSVGEAFYGTESCSDLTDNRHVLLTRKDNLVYVILHKPPVTNAVRLRPISAMPLKATLLNTGQPVDCLVNRIPGYGPMVDADPVLRLRDLPVNELAGDVLVIRLEFAPVEATRFTGGHQGTDGEREFSADAYE